MAEHRTALRVVTWNVGEVYWPWQGNELKDADAPVVRDVIEELDADVVLLQELDHVGQLDVIAGERYVGQMSACGYDRHVGVLVRRGFDVQFHDHVLAPTKRGCMEARFDLDGQETRVFSLHFDVFARARRLLQVREAASIIGARAPALTIAGGDFNYDPIASARLGYEDDLQAEAALRAHLDDAAADCGPTLIGLLRVDRMLASGARYAGARAFTSPRRTPLGDHAPLVCDVRLR